MVDDDNTPPLGSTDEEVREWMDQRFLEIDVASGQALRALTILEQHAFMVLHCALYGLDREVIEIIVGGTSVGVALDKARKIAASEIVKSQDHELAEDAKDVVARVKAIFEERNLLAHQMLSIPLEDDDLSFRRYGRGLREAGAVTVEQLRDLRIAAMELQQPLLGIGARLLNALIAVGPPRFQGKHPRVHAYPPRPGDPPTAT